MTYSDEKLEYLEGIQKQRRQIYRLDITFMGGTQIKDACQIMYDLHIETGKIVTATFNNVVLTMDRKS